jgi:hypothetical protein
LISGHDRASRHTYWWRLVYICVSSPLPARPHREICGSYVAPQPRCTRCRIGRPLAATMHLLSGSLPVLLASLRLASLVRRNGGIILIPACQLPFRRPAKRARLSSQPIVPVLKKVSLQLLSVSNPSIHLGERGQGLRWQKVRRCFNSGSAADVTHASNCYSNCKDRSSEQHDRLRLRRCDYGADAALLMLLMRAFRPSNYASPCVKGT